MNVKFGKYENSAFEQIISDKINHLYNQNLTKVFLDDFERIVYKAYSSEPESGFIKMKIIQHMAYAHENELPCHVEVFSTKVGDALYISE